MNEYGDIGTPRSGPGLTARSARQAAGRVRRFAAALRRFAHEVHLGQQALLEMQFDGERYVLPDGADRELRWRPGFGGWVLSGDLLPDCLVCD